MKARKSAKPKGVSATPRAYSYVRYSTPEQAKGDSVRRQVALSEAWSRKKGIPLDASLRMSDKGKSAYSEKNRTEGALGKFLADVAAGRVPRGSYLLVESLDRLSRAQVRSALRLFLGLLDAGITIVTLADDQEYSDEDCDEIDLIISIIIMSRAHNESVMKSSRLKSSWANKRGQSGVKKLTSLAPAWLQLSQDGTHFEVVKHRAAVVRWLFKQRANGVGVFGLARQLQDRKEPVWGRGKRAGYQWHKSYVTKILANRSVLGEFQPHRMDGEPHDRKRVPDGNPVPNYFPAIISEELFHRVQQLKREDQKRPGQIGKNVSSLFTWIAKCGRTGKPANFVNKSKYQYLKTDGVLEDGRRMAGWSYKDFETRFLTAIGRLDFSQIFGAKEDSRTTEMEGALAAATARVEETQIRIDRLVNLIESSDEKAPETVLDRIRELEAQRADQGREVQTAETALKKTRDAAADAAKFSSDFKRLMAERHKPETRLALRQEIRSIVSRIDVYFDVAETPAEREKREAFAAAVSKIPKGIKVIGGMPSSKPPARHMVVTFANGEQRTIAQSHDGKVLVYESNNTPAAFQVVEIPRRTNSFKAVDDNAEIDRLPLSLAQK
jgi:DNA invertase Pin-like site-specific DNA recombinase